ncbi:MAG: tail fiber domain-containing protein [Ferruginibacter sp.]
MKKTIFHYTISFILFFVLLNVSESYAQNVSIGTNTPNASALLHIDVSTSTTKGLLVTGVYNSVSSIPDLGTGSRMMFYPGKSAFRAGFASGTSWDNANVGLNSTGIGLATKASGNVSTAMGYQTTASGYSSTAMGYLTTASGDGSTAMGYQSQASGENCIAIGSLTVASGKRSIAIGSNTVAAGDYSNAMGHSTITNGYGSTVIGIFNEPIISTAETSVTPSTPLFIIGNGVNVSNLSNAMVVRKDGNVGIGTDVPTAKLHVNNGDINLSDGMIQLQTGTIDKGFIQLSGNDLRMGVNSSNSTGNVVFRLNANDRFTIFPNGNATLTGILTQSSDARLKNNISPVSNAIQQLILINGYHYYWKNKQADNIMQTGVLAQEVQKVFPELVKEDATGTLSVNYSGLIPYMIEAVKEQQKQIDELKKTVEELKKLF